MRAIYGIINKINGHKYVGSSVNFYKRKREHIRLLKKGKHHSDYLQKAWNKYEEKLFEFIVLEEVEHKEDLIKREQWWLDNSNCEYNICKIAGNTLGVKCSEETKKKISLANSGKRSKLQLEAHKNRRKPVDQYDLNGNYIKSWNSTQEAGEFLGKNHKGIIDAACGKSNISHGFRWAYSGDKLREPIRTNQKYIYQYSLNGEFIKEWYTLAEAGRFYNIKTSSITECAKGNQKTCAGYIWKYKKD